jgi:hypothetical protein
LRVKGILATSDTSWDDFERFEKEREAKKEEEKKLKFGEAMDPKMPEGGGRGLKQ